MHAHKRHPCWYGEALACKASGSKSWGISQAFLHVPPGGGRARKSHGAGILESQNHLGWKKPLRSSSPTINLTLPSPPLSHAPKHHVYTAFKHLQGWWLHRFPGQPVPVLGNPFSGQIVPNIQSKPPLA